MHTFSLLAALNIFDATWKNVRLFFHCMWGLEKKNTSQLNKVLAILIVTELKLHMTV